MSLTTTQLVTTMPFVVDPASVTRHPGRVVDWASLPASFIPTGATKKQLRAGLVIGVKNGRWLPCAVSVTLTSVVVATNVATATLANHGFAAGDVVTIAGANLAYVNGSKTIIAVTSTTFTFAATGADATATGTITCRVSARAILATAAQEGGPDALTGHGAYVGGLFYETDLPDATGGPPKTLPAAYKTELAAAVTTGFAFLPFTNSLAV